MLQHPSSRATAGRKPSVDHDRLLSVATRLADDEGLDAVTFRALADRFGVSPMAVHRATGGIEALRHALVSGLVEQAVLSVEWPETWQDIVRVFATDLRDLLLRHPLVLEAHRHAALVAPGADDVAHRVVAALAGAGLGSEQAAYGYAAVHDFVTGHVAIRLGRGELELLSASDERKNASVFVDFHDYERRFDLGLSVIIAGLAAIAAEGGTA